MNFSAFGSFPIPHQFATTAVTSTPSSTQVSYLKLKIINNLNIIMNIKESKGLLNI